ncbi:hypothetical protein [Nocardia pneumoniae]|nr:hypothetical protein [Nocardia pneumoniae]
MPTKHCPSHTNQVEISISFYNVVISITYHHDGLGEKKFTQP